MRISFREKTPSLKVKHSSFDYLSKIFLSAHKYSDTTITLNMPRAAHGDGNMTAVLAAVGFKLKRLNNNRIDIGPRRHGYNRVRIEENLFGKHCHSFAFDRLAYWSGATPPRIFETKDYHDFTEYLVKDIIRTDWKCHIPAIPSLRLKSFLKQLFTNIVEHGGNNSPVFISSSFKDGLLAFTIMDCGLGFLNSVNRFDSQVISHKQAIEWVMSGKRTKQRHRGHKGTIQMLGNYCNGNGGYLHIVSGNASLEYKPKGKYGFEQLSSSIAGTIISFGIKVSLPKFE